MSSDKEFVGGSRPIGAEYIRPLPIEYSQAQIDRIDSLTSDDLEKRVDYQKSPKEGYVAADIKGRLNFEYDVAAVTNRTEVGSHSLNTDVVWAIDVINDIRGNVVYTADNDANIIAYDVENSQKLWEHSQHLVTAYGVERYDDVVYSCGAGQDVIAVEADNGGITDQDQSGLVWKHDLHDQTIFDIAVTDSTVYTVGGDGQFIGVDRQTGNQLFKEDGFLPNNLFAVATDRYTSLMYVAGEDGIVKAYDPATNTSPWTYTGNHTTEIRALHASEATEDPDVDDPRVYSADRNGNITARNAIDGSLDGTGWENSLGEFGLWGVHESNGILYAAYDFDENGVSQGSVVGINSANGFELWEKEINHDTGVRDVAAELGTLYSGDRDGNVHFSQFTNLDYGNQTNFRPFTFNLYVYDGDEWNTVNDYDVIRSIVLLSMTVDEYVDTSTDSLPAVVDRTSIVEGDGSAVDEIRVGYNGKWVPYYGDLRNPWEVQRDRSAGSKPHE